MTSTSAKAAVAGQHRRTRRAAPVTLGDSDVVGGGIQKRPLSLVPPMGPDVSIVISADSAATAFSPIPPIADRRKRRCDIAAADSPLTSGKHRHKERGHQVRRLGTKSGAGVFHTIINQMPPHRVYIEPFVGWGSIMKAKLPADRNIGIDINADRIQTLRLELPAAELTIGDGIRFLQNFKWQGGELVYCDPPYLLETRTSRQRYQFEISDHSRLLEALVSLPCPVILSGYYSKLYAKTLRTWRAITYTGQTRGGPRTEYLWCNFPEPLELHDYRYLGKDFRERQNLKRKIQRWSKKLSGMPSLERHALMAAIQNVHFEQSQHSFDDRARAFTELPMP